MNRGAIIEGERRIVAILDDPLCHFISAPAFTRQDGFCVQYNLGNSLFACARDEAARARAVPGCLWHWFPKTGRFYIGFVLIEDMNAMFSFDFFIQGKCQFRLATRHGDGLRRIYFSGKPFDLEYAQTFELRFDGDGTRQALEGLVFLGEAPMKRAQRIRPRRVSREAKVVRHLPLRKCLLYNPGGFALSREVLRLPVPAPWPEGTVLRCGKRELPWAPLPHSNTVAVYVDGRVGRKREITAIPPSSGIGHRRLTENPRFMLKSTPGKITLKDSISSWSVELRHNAFCVSRNERSWCFHPVIETGAGQLLETKGKLTLTAFTPFEVCVEACFDYGEFLHSTRLHLVAESTRVDLEHLIEIHVTEPFACPRRYGLRVEAMKSERDSLRAIGADGSLKTCKGRFRACFHTEKLLTPRPPGLPHSLLWNGVQFAVQDMAWSAPIAIDADDDNLRLDLLPPADSVVLDADDEYRVRNQFFIEDGRYKLRAGMSRRHFSAWQTDPRKRSSALLHEAHRLDNPPYLIAPLRMDGQLEKTSPSFAGRAEYREPLRRWTEAYLKNQNRMRAFGFFSYGDWFGERVNNWGNNEYDTPYGFLVNFMATGDPVLRRLGLAAARHQLDVDTCHGTHPHAGRQLMHSMGHGGPYYPAEYRVGAYGDVGVSISHTWVEGMLLYERITGDPRARAVATLLLDDLAAPERTRNWVFTDGRDAGWHLIALCAGYQFIGRSCYLKAASGLVEKIIERQRKDGGFRRVLTSGHCECFPKHTGEAAFMMGVLLDGLQRFHCLTGDPVVKDAIIALARWVVAEMWDTDRKVFRYTSCPGSGEGGTPLEGLAYAARLSGDRALLAICRNQFKRFAGATVAKRVVQGSIKYGEEACGKLVSQRLRVLPRVCHVITERRWRMVEES